MYNNLDKIALYNTAQMLINYNIFFFIVKDILTLTFIEYLFPVYGY